MHVSNSFTLLIFEHTRIQTLFWILLFFWFLNTFEFKRCKFFNFSDLRKHFCVLKLENIWPINNVENKCLYSLCFWIHLNSTLLVIMRIKIIGRLPWVKNYQRLRKPSRQVCGKSFKRERSDRTCSPWYFNVFYLHNFVWEDCKMWDYREKTKQTWNGLEVLCKYIVKEPFHLIWNVQKFIKWLLIEDNKVKIKIYYVSHFWDMLNLFDGLRAHALCPV